MIEISIIIPCKVIDTKVARCLDYCREQSVDKEILVITDEVCPGLPSAKRNYAMTIATGDILAFIDSDAYPSEHWLWNAMLWLKSFDAVCGPGVLPPDAPLSEKIADQVHKWIFCSYRVVPKLARVVPWHPTFNLIVKREVATTFDDYLTGEDDKFCLRIKDGVFYHPDILVYHNRRGAFKPLWKQFATWGSHKGAFVGIAFVAWVSTLFVYAFNWIKGFIRRKP